MGKAKNRAKKQAVTYKIKKQGEEESRHDGTSMPRINHPTQSSRSSCVRRSLRCQAQARPKESNARQRFENEWSYGSSVAQGWGLRHVYSWSAPGVRRTPSSALEHGGDDSSMSESVVQNESEGMNAGSAKLRPEPAKTLLSG